MNLNAIECLAVFFISLLLAGIIIPQILLISFRKNLFDEIDERKIHQGRVPRLGGIAFMPSMIFSVACVTGVYCLLGIREGSMMSGGAVPAWPTTLSACVTAPNSWLRFLQQVSLPCRV